MRQHTRSSAYPATIPIDDCADPESALMLLIYLRASTRAGRPHFFFNPISVCGDAVRDLQRARLVTVRDVSPPEYPCFSAELVEAAA